MKPAPMTELSPELVEKVDAAIGHTLLGVMLTLSEAKQIRAALFTLSDENTMLREELEYFVDIMDGTEDTGFDPHVEQMLMDAAESARTALSHKETNR